ncbi:MAG: hypothetical protein AAFO68_11865, partial [Pseudomonadota bacterium]
AVSAFLFGDVYCVLMASSAPASASFRVAFAAWGMCVGETARRLDRDVYSTQLSLEKREACLRAFSPVMFSNKDIVGRSACWLSHRMPS